MQSKQKAATTSVSSEKILLTSEPRLHVDRPTVFDIDNVTVTLGNELVLENVSLCVHQGEFIGLIGPNGAGKTTLLRAILGLTAKYRGTIRTDRSTIGYIPQRGNLYNGLVPMSVREVVSLGAHGDRAAVDAALASAGIEALAKVRFTELSGGQQQRVVIAKALAAHADVLILDEPTTGIDEHAQAAFYDLLRKLQAQGITLIMVSHEVESVLKLVTRVICLNRTIVYDGVPEHFEADTYLPQWYKAHHQQLHHHHGGVDV